MIYYVRIFNYLLRLIYIYDLYNFFSVIRILNNAASNSETFINLCVFYFCFLKI